MRVVFLLIFFLAASFGELHFNSKTRNFSIELLYHTVQDSNRDVMISPYVIWSLLISMAYETLGATQEQFSKVFSLTENRSEVVEEYMKLRTLVLGNKKYVPTVLLNFVIYDESYNVYPDSIRRLESDFSYITKRLSFQEPQQAMESALSFLRSYHVPPENLLRTEDFEDSTMIMCNYCSFRALWSSFFKISSAKKVYYYQDGNVVAKTNMMFKKTPVRFSDFESLHASVTELPYSGGEYYMLLVRPHAGYDITQVLRNLREVSWKDMLDKLHGDGGNDYGRRRVEVKLPMVATTSRVVLNRPLINMGLSDGFDRNSSNFDNFAEDKIYIGEITHKVTVMFTQFETMVYTATPTYPLYTKTSKQMLVKEPFIFLIMERSTDTVLFGGTYTKIDID